MSIAGLTIEQIAGLIGIGIFVPGAIIFTTMIFESYQQLEDLKAKKKEDTDSAQQKTDEQLKQKHISRIRKCRKIEMIWPFLAMVDAYFQWTRASIYFLIPPAVIQIPEFFKKRKTDKELMEFDIDKVGIIVSMKMMTYFAYAFYLLAKIYQSGKVQ